MKLIVGLGNPGHEYSKTRHNVGFEVIDEIAKKLDIKLSQKNFNCEFFNNNDFILIKPLTFMNLSGEAVKKVVDFYKVRISDIIVVCDDLDIPLGQSKIKISNSSGGHNGIKDIIDKLGSPNFYRLRVGIGRPTNKEMSISSFVLSKFDTNEEKIINEVISRSADAIISSIYNGLNYVINNFNKRIKKK